MIQLLDKLLEKRKLKYDELTQEEKDTYQTWFKALEGKSLEVADIKNYIVSMKSAVAMELSDTTEKDTEKNLVLKARLKNYSLLEEMLSGPEKAQAALSKYIAGQAESV